MGLQRSGIMDVRSVLSFDRTATGSGLGISHFPGSPLDLRYAFRLESGKITYLEVTQ